MIADFRSSTISNSQFHRKKRHRTFSPQRPEAKEYSLSDSTLALSERQLHDLGSENSVSILTDQNHSQVLQGKQKKAYGWIIAGPIITFLGAVSYFLVFAQFPTLRDTPWVNIPLVVIGCGISFRGLLSAFQERHRWVRCLLSGAGLLLSIGLTGLFLTYVGYLSFQLPAESEIGASMSVIPPFTSTDQSGSTFNSVDLIGTNLILIFYRGHW